jgi:hypothetical protein
MGSGSDKGDKGKKGGSKGSGQGSGAGSGKGASGRDDRSGWVDKSDKSERSQRKELSDRGDKLEFPNRPPETSDVKAEPRGTDAKKPETKPETTPEPTPFVAGRTETKAPSDGFAEDVDKLHKKLQKLDATLDKKSNKKWSGSSEWEEGTDKSSVMREREAVVRELKAAYVQNLSKAKEGDVVSVSGEAVDSEFMQTLASAAKRSVKVQVVFDAGSPAGGSKRVMELKKLGLNVTLNVRDPDSVKPVSYQKRSPPATESEEDSAQ